MTPDQPHRSLALTIVDDAISSDGSGAAAITAAVVAEVAAGPGLTAPDVLTRTAKVAGWTDAGQSAIPADLKEAQ
jgi:hypothetical protein